MALNGDIYDQIQPTMERAELMGMGDVVSTCERALRGEVKDYITLLVLLQSPWTIDYVNQAKEEKRLIREHHRYLHGPDMNPITRREMERELGQVLKNVRHSYVLLETVAKEFIRYHSPGCTDTQ